MYMYSTCMYGQQVGNHPNFLCFFPLAIECNLIAMPYRLNSIYLYSSITGLLQSPIYPQEWTLMPTRFVHTAVALCLTPWGELSIQTHFFHPCTKLHVTDAHHSNQICITSVRVSLSNGKCCRLAEKQTPAAAFLMT